MKKLIKVMLFIGLGGLFTGSTSFSDQYVRMDIKDTVEAGEEWHHSLNPNRLQFKRFEAVVRDSAGKQYALIASIAGNRFMYEVHAWLATADQWYEIYKERPKMKSKGADVWTKDRKLVYTGDISNGWRIEARGEKASFEVLAAPRQPASQYSVAGESADFDGHISFGTEVSGKIVIDGKTISVDGFGYCTHTFGDMGKHTTWKAFCFKDEKLCITAMNAKFDDDRMNMFVTSDGDKGMTLYRPEKVFWKELDENTWQISATHNEPDQGDMQIDVTIRLIEPRPTNKNQPYSKYSRLRITFSTTYLYEYLADMQVTITGPDPGDKVEIRSLGVATDFELIR